MILKDLKLLIHQLDTNGTILLQSGLSSNISKAVDQDVTITTTLDSFFPTFSANFKVKGLFNVLPAIFYSWNDVWYDETIVAYNAIMSWNTYFDITNSNSSTTTGYFLVGLDDYTKADEVEEEIGQLYQTLGSPWNTTYTNANWEYRTVLEEIGQINEILSLVYIIIISILYIGLCISMLGLSTSMIMSVNQKRTQLGILRSVGISKKQVVKLVFGETLIISTTAIFIGIITGILTAFLLSNVPFMAYAPFILTINWNFITLTSLLMVGLSLFVSILPAIKASQLNIIDSIRKRGM